MKPILIVSVIFFLIVPNSSQGSQFPVKVVYNKEASCQRVGNLDTFNIKQVLDSINFDLKDSTFIACCYHQIAVKYYYDDEYINSTFYSKLAENLRLQLDDTQLWKTYLNLGVTYYEMDAYNLAIENFNKAYYTKGLKKSADSSTIFIHLGEIYSNKGEYEPAIEYTIKAINTNIDIETSNEYKNILSRILIETKDTEKIKLGIEQCEQLLKNSTFNQNAYNVEFALLNLANAHNNLGSYKKSIKYYKIILNNIKDDENLKTILLNNIATVFTYQKKYLLAIDYIKKSLAIKIELHKKNHEFSYNYENLADNYLALLDFDTSLKHYQKAIVNLTNNYRTLNVFDNPAPNDSLFIHSYPMMIRILHLKATAAFKYYQQNKEEKYLTLANQTYQAAFDFHNQLQKEISTENSRLFQAKNIVTYLENALNATYQLQNNGQSVGEAAFRFMEKNKATVLLQSMNESAALKYANIPDTLIEQEKDLKIAITFYKKQLNDAILYEDSTEIKRLDKLVFDNKQHHLKLIKELEKKYPDYYNLKYQQNQSTLQDVQAYLDNKTALLEYFIGDSNIYILSIQKEKAKLYQQKKPANWHQTLKNFRQALTSKEIINSATSTKKLDSLYIYSATKLYKWLLDKPLSELDYNDINNLQIIPDAGLNYLPFGALFKNSEYNFPINYKKLPYLIKDKAIAYSYSGALLLEQYENQKLEHKKLTYGGFAPGYGQGSGQFKLPFAKKSVEENSDLLNGKAFLNKEATKTNFEQTANQFGIIQLAMHVLMNDEKPMDSELLFSYTADSTQTALRAAELYNMNLNAELAVLSACNTGSGKLQNGEGVMSLSRAFTYAGCASLMMSLWSIVDQSTATIVNFFFKNLKEGKAKHVALQQAKITYLQNAPAEQSHPLYWAGLVLTGNKKAISINKSLSPLWVLIVLPFTFFGFYFFQRKVK